MTTILKSPTEASKRIRVELKAKWPMVKFSVRTEYYSMGNSINISWDLGPTTRQVDAVVGKYQVGTFDGMTDCYNYEPTLVLDRDNEVAELGGAKYVHTNRHTPQVLYDQMCRDYAVLLGQPIPAGTEPWNHRIVSHRESITTLVNQLMSVYDLTAHGYQGIEHAKDEFGNEKLGAASHVDEFYVMVGGVRQDRY